MVAIPEPQSAVFSRRRVLRHALAPALAVAAGLPLWPSVSQAQASATAAALQVAAATSLVDVMPALAQAFARQRGVPAPVVATGASGALVDALGQRGRSAQTDVVLADDAETIARGVERRLLRPEPVRNFASHALVLVVPAASRLPVRRLTDLAGADVQRIALGRVATVPQGRFGRQAIDAARLWPSVQRKVVQTDSARDTLQRVVAGEADAGIVFATDALSAGAAVRVVETLGGHGAIRLTAAVAATSAQPALAADFVSFLRSAEAAALLAKAGFGPA